MEECVNKTLMPTVPAKEIEGMGENCSSLWSNLRLPVMVIDLVFKFQMICLGEIKKIFNRKQSETYGRW